MKKIFFFFSLIFTFNILLMPLYTYANAVTITGVIVQEEYATYDLIQYSYTGHTSNATHYLAYYHSTNPTPPSVGFYNVRIATANTESGVIPQGANIMANHSSYPYYLHTCLKNIETSEFSSCATYTNSAPPVIPTPSPTPTPTPTVTPPPAPDIFIDLNGERLNWEYVPEASTYNVYQDGVFVTNTGYSHHVISCTGSNTWEVTSVDVNGVESSMSNAVSNTNNEEWCEEPPPTDPPPDEFTLEDCANLICQCVASLQPTLDLINQNTNGLIPKLQEILNTNNQISGTLSAIKTQLTPTATYPINDMSSYPNIPLEDNKPIMRETVFTDNTIYFQDQGDDVSPPPFPSAPEPTTTWTDKDGSIVSKQSAIIPDLNMVKDSNLTKESSQMKDTALTKQTELVKEQSIIRDTEIIRATEQQREQPMQMQINNHPLRWNSTDYIP